MHIAWVTKMPFTGAEHRHLCVCEHHGHNQATARCAHAGSVIGVLADGDNEFVNV